MTDFFSLPEFAHYFLILVNLLVLTIDVYCLASCIIFELKKKHIAKNIILTVFTGVLFCFAVSANVDYRRNYSTEGFFIDFFREYFPMLTVILAVLMVLSVFSLYSVSKWKQRNINPASIKEGLDRLPAGLCYHNEYGVPRLINHRMDNLCRHIIGEPLFDANDFWRRLTTGDVLAENIVRRTGGNPIVTVYGGITLSFTKIERKIAGEKLYEIRATDVTKQFALNDELRMSNYELRQLNIRLQQYGESVYDITREREVLAAKINIHDMLGKAQLATKRYIENTGSDITKQELIDMWKSTLYLFDGGFTQNNQEENLDELYEAAKIMGIQLGIDGKPPRDKGVLRFLMSGARESLTNAVHHAKASELRVRISRSDGFCVIEYTNNGIQPTCEISEGGGLSSLRQLVEASGGIMETDIYPQFVLRLKIPSEEAYYV